ncbi:hypothetical protein FHU10_0363 [Serratia fonticola]|uniref:Uncharacterized protein n=1 Tax=Serratia fonticola TaxID=47917 RepID=A0A542BLR4_SERFO|nr:hypothetical protein FHU09_2087 [Serratia fonticola]TQI98436.1 hypothetical protein FHU11_3961 [Serratia fonticola]TVZ67964.1 hypothetical protein FHU10_0363 [Serratia fonticola]
MRFEQHQSGPRLEPRNGVQPAKYDEYRVVLLRQNDLA